MFIVCPLLLAACTNESRIVAPREMIVTSDLAIGGADSGAFSLSRVADIAVDAHGRIYVLDESEHAVRVFTSAGAFLRRIGRRGRGPGEFLDPNGMDISSEDHLFVYDPMQQRLSEFDSSGTLVHGHQIRISSFGPRWDGGVDAEGRLLDKQARVLTDTTWEWSVRRLNLDSGEDQRLTYPTCGLQGPVELRHESGIAGVPFGQERVIRVDPLHGVWCANSSRAVAYLVPFGQSVPTDSFVSVALAELVTPADRAQARVSLRRQMIPPAIVERALGLIPERKPLVEGLGVDDRGGLWMLLNDESGPVFHVFTPDTRWTARIRLRERVAKGHHFVVRGDHLYAVTLDSLDVPEVRRYPLPNLSER